MTYNDNQRNSASNSIRSCSNKKNRKKIDKETSNLKRFLLILFLKQLTGT